MSPEGVSDTIDRAIAQIRRETAEAIAKLEEEKKLRPVYVIRGSAPRRVA